MAKTGFIYLVLEFKLLIIPEYRSKGSFGITFFESFNKCYIKMRLFSSDYFSFLSEISCW